MALLPKRPPAEKPAGFDSSARAQLGLAIQGADAARGNLARLRQAIARLEQDGFTAAETVLAAEAELDRAREAEPAYLVKRALGEPAVVPKTTGQAQAELADARGILAATREARDRLRAEADRAAEAADWAERRLDAAATGVLAEAPAVAALLDEIERLQTKLAEKGLAAIWLARHVFEPRPGQVPDAMPSAARRARDLANQVQTAGPLWPAWSAIARTAVATPWAEVLAALKADANAPLP